jgi:spore cortex formation protein SpoVR/YcgB (stage V sporulation)
MDPVPDSASRDRVIDEVHAIKEAHARRFDFDLHQIIEDARSRQESSGRTIRRVEQVPQRTDA